MRLAPVRGGAAARSSVTMSDELLSHVAAVLAPFSESDASPAASPPGAPAADVPTSFAADARALNTRARAMPRSIQVVPVSVPDTFGRDRLVTFDIAPTGGATIVPPLQGRLATGGAGPRVLMVAVSVPAAALAGPRTVGQVRFTQGDLTIPVPLDLDVARVPGATFRLAQQLFGARPGERLVIHYLLTNSGNGPDTFDVTVVVPPQWRADQAPRRYALDAGATVSGDVSVTVPSASVSGIYHVTLHASADGHALATGDAVIELLETPGGKALGPRLVAGVVSVLEDSGRANPVFGLELQGPVTDQVQAFGRLVQASEPGEVDPRGLARVGYFVGAPFLTLSAPNWTATGGSTGRSFSDITGVSAYGRGLSVGWNNPQLSASGLAATPTSVAPGGDGGHLLGVRLADQILPGGGQVNATLTDFDDPQLAPRRLQAVGVGAVSPVFSGMTLSGEVAQRDYDAGSGIGWLTELKRQTREDYGSLRIEHAPGGSTAFAYARDAVSAVASRMVGPRAAIGAAYWSSDDDTPTFSSLHTVGWSITPRYDLSDRSALTLEARSNSFDAQSAAGLIGNAETTVRLGLSDQRGTLFLSGSASVGTTTQTLGFPGTPTVATTAGRQSVSASAGMATGRGTVELSAGYDHSGAGIGLLTNAIVLGLRASGVPLGRGLHSPILNGELDYYSWLGDRAAVTVARVGIVAPLPGDLSLTVDIERNPFLTGLDGGARIIPVVKIERAMHLPLGSLQPTAKGEVFEDRNGNGVRDPGEPAIAGAVVRRGSETFVTDQSGKFRFYDKGDTPVHLDETSLPFGMIANTAAPAERQPAKDVKIGVIPTADVDVNLVPTADSSGRIPQGDFTGVQVQATDTSGAAWSAWADKKGHAHFSALPPGHYHLQFDFGALREPVHLHEPVPDFVVEPGHAVAPITVPVYPRPVRLFDGGHGGRGLSSHLGTSVTP